MSLIFFKLFVCLWHGCESGWTLPGSEFEIREKPDLIFAKTGSNLREKPDPIFEKITQIQFRFRPSKTTRIRILPNLDNFFNFFTRWFIFTHGLNMIQLHIWTIFFAIYICVLDNWFSAEFLESSYMAKHQTHSNKSLLTKFSLQ